MLSLISVASKNLFHAYRGTWFTAFAKLFFWCHRKWEDDTFCTTGAVSKEKTNFRPASWKTRDGVDCAKQLNERNGRIRVKNYLLLKELTNQSPCALVMGEKSRTFWTMWRASSRASLCCPFVPSLLSQRAWKFIPSDSFVLNSRECVYIPSARTY